MAKPAMGNEKVSLPRLKPAGVMLKITKLSPVVPPWMMPSLVPKVVMVKLVDETAVEKAAL